MTNTLLWDLPGDVLAAPASTLCGWRGANSLSFYLLYTVYAVAYLSLLVQSVAQYLLVYHTFRWSLIRRTRGCVPPLPDFRAMPCPCSPSSFSQCFTLDLQGPYMALHCKDSRSIQSEGLTSPRGRAFCVLCHCARFSYAANLGQFCRQASMYCNATYVTSQRPRMPLGSKLGACAPREASSHWLAHPCNSGDKCSSSLHENRCKLVMTTRAEARPPA